MAKRYEDHPEVIGYDIRNEAAAKTPKMSSRTPQMHMASHKYLYN